MQLNEEVRNFLGNCDVKFSGNETSCVKVEIYQTC